MGRIMVLMAALVLTVLTVVGRFRHRYTHQNGVCTHHKGCKHSHGSWLSIDYFAYSSKIGHWSPAFKVILSLLTIIFCICLNNVYVSAVVIFSMAYLVIEIGGLSSGDYVSVLTIPLAFILLSILAIAVDFSSRPIGEYHLFLGLGYLYTTPLMLRNGLFLMLKILASISALQLMILTTPSSEILSVLRRTRLPATLIDLMHMIYRYIFILLDVFAKMKDSAESRLGYHDVKTSFRTFGGIASNMLVVSLKKAGAYYDAMEARCYDGELMFLEEEKPLASWQVAAAGAFFLYLLILWYQTR